MRKRQGFLPARQGGLGGYPIRADFQPDRSVVHAVPSGYRFAVRTRCKSAWICRAGGCAGSSRGFPNRRRRCVGLICRIRIFQALLAERIRKTSFVRAEIIFKKFCFKVCRGTPQAGDEYTAFRTERKGMTEWLYRNAHR